MRSPAIPRLNESGERGSFTLPSERGVDEANVSSNRDAIEGERNFQGLTASTPLPFGNSSELDCSHLLAAFLMAYLSLTALYLTVPEMEMNHGYCDIFLMPDKKNYPAVKHSYIIELKYLSAKDNEETAKKQREEAVKQLQLYAADRKVEQMTRDTELHLIVMQVRVCELVRLEEV